MTHRDPFQRLPLCDSEMAFVWMGQGGIFDGGKTLQQRDRGTNKHSREYLTQRSKGSYNP